MPEHRDLTRSGLLSAAFDRAAPTYDRMVGLNPGYHRHLRAAAQVLVADLADGDLVLDLGCGSGASTHALLASANDVGVRLRVVGIDASRGMIDRARAKHWPSGVTFEVGRAEELAHMALPGPARGALCCYLLRNLPNLPQGMRAIAAALTPGARLVAQEYSVRADRSARLRWRAVNGAIIRPLATLVAREAQLYDYLHTSVEEFCSIDEVARCMQDAGFVAVRSRTVGGWQRGILHTITGRLG